jgi:hypothetical protein
MHFLGVIMTCEAFQLNSRSPPSWDRAPPPGKESRLRLRLQGRQSHTHSTGRSSPRNLPRSLHTDPLSPHACSTPGECTFSVTQTVLRLPVSLTLGYRNRPDRNSLGSMAATGVPSRSSLLPLRTLSPGGVAHRPTSLTQSSTA